MKDKEKNVGRLFDNMPIGLDISRLSCTLLNDQYPWGIFWFNRFTWAFLYQLPSTNIP